MCSQQSYVRILVVTSQAQQSVSDVAQELAALLQPGILARAIECEKHVVSNGTKSIKKAGQVYRRQLAEIAELVRPFLKPTVEERVLTVYRVGNLTFGGRPLFETQAEICVQTLDGSTWRIPKQL